MKKYCEMSREELLDLKKELDREFAEIKAEGLALDMSRGKPAPDQLDLSMKMMEVLAGDADLKCAVTMVSSTESRKPRDFSARCLR